MATGYIYIYRERERGVGREGGREGGERPCLAWPWKTAAPLATIRQRDGRTAYLASVGRCGRSAARVAKQSMYRSEKLHYTTSTSNGLPPFQVDGATERGRYRDEDNKSAMAKDKIIFDFALLQGPMA